MRARDPFDIVVAATGFHVSFPFLAPGLVPLKGPVAEVYGGMMTAEHCHLYIVGWMQPRYGFGPLIVPAVASPDHHVARAHAQSVWPDPQATWPKTGTNPSI